MLNSKRPNEPNTTLRQAADQPALPTAELMEHLTFLVTDIRNSTEDWGRRPEATYRALAAHDRIIVAAVESHGGRVFNIVGDAVLAAFEKASDALEAALAAQAGLKVRDQRVPEGELKLAARVCIGLHSGTVYRLGDDYRGLELCRVARIVHQGRGGEILATRTIARRLRRRLPEGCRLRNRGHAYLQGILEPERLYRVEQHDAAREVRRRPAFRWNLQQGRLQRVTALTLVSMLLIGQATAAPSTRTVDDGSEISATACPLDNSAPAWKPGDRAGPRQESSRALIEPAEVDRSTERNHR